VSDESQVPADQQAAPVGVDAGDRELLAGVARGDEQAMMSLVRRYEAELYRVTLRITGRREDAEEATQDAFLQIFRKAGTFQGRASVRTWIYSIALNAARMRRRSQARHTEREVASLEEYFQEDGQFREEVTSFRFPDQDVLTSEARDVIVTAIDTLPELDRSIVVLADQEDMSAREIAETVQLTEAAVKSRLHRARVVLRRALADYFRPSSAGSAEGGSTHPPRAAAR
jgi:RNA polymerase sigma-70 factor (ECF subfamily)